MVTCLTVEFRADFLYFGFHRLGGTEVDPPCFCPAETLTEIRCHSPATGMESLVPFPMARRYAVLNSIDADMNKFLWAWREFIRICI